MCAYYLPGSNIAYDRDYVDDKEQKAGWHLLDLLTQHNIKHRAIYIVRYYGVQEVGASRYNSYKEAATSAISRSSYNSIVKANQFPLSAVVEKSTNFSTTTKNSGYSCAASPCPYPLAQTVNMDTCNSWPKSSSTINSWADDAAGDLDMEVAFRGHADSFPGLPSKLVPSQASRCVQAALGHPPAHSQPTRARIMLFPWLVAKSSDL